MLQRLGFPAVGRHGRIVTAFGIDALGSGVWMPVSVLYFVAATPLSITQIGLALSLATAVAMPVTLAVGGLVDRFGAKRMLQTGNLLQAAGFAAYPFAHDLLVVTAVVAVSACGRTAFWGSYAPLVTALSAPGERERWFGFLGALRNAGFAVGGLLAAGLLAAEDEMLLHAIAGVNAASYVLAFLLVLPLATGRRPDQPERPAAPGPAGGAEVAPEAGFGTVLRDRGFRWLLGANLGFALGSMVLTVVIPVYLVTLLGLPPWLPAVVYVINTVLVGLTQGLTVQRMTGHLRWRIVMAAALATITSYVLLLVVGSVGVAAGIAIALLATVVFTVGEMLGAPVLAAMSAEAAPVHLRGRYQAVYQLSWNSAAALAPVLFLWLFDHGEVRAWAVLCAVVAAGAACCVPMGRRLPVAAQAVRNQILEPTRR